MEQFEQEKALLESQDICPVTTQQVFKHKSYDTKSIVLEELFLAYKAYLGEQAKKGKLTFQEYKDAVAKKWGHVDYDNYKKTLLRGISEYDLLDEAAELYAIQFISFAPSEVENMLLSHRIKELEKEVQQHRDNQFIPVAYDKDILQEAITALLSHADGDFVSKADALNAGSNLHNLMIGIPAAPGEQWISVKDRLPAIDGFYIVNILDAGYGKQWRANLRFKSGEWVSTFLDDVTFITHWMPLPAAPESTTSTKQP